MKKIFDTLAEYTCVALRRFLKECPDILSPTPSFSNPILTSSSTSESDELLVD